MPTQYVECSSSGRAFKMLFWSANSVRGMLFRWLGQESTLLFLGVHSVGGMLFVVAGPSKCSFFVKLLFECKVSTRNALPVAGP